MSAELAELFKHNLWANLQLFDTCAALSDAQLDASSPGTYGSIRDTLVHLASGEELYVHMLRGQARPPRREDQAFPGFAALRELVTSTGQQLIRLAETDAIPASWLDPVEHEELQGRMIVILAINHATEHRTHVNSTLSHLGLEPAYVDGWAYGYTHGLMKIPEPGQ